MSLVDHEFALWPVDDLHPHEETRDRRVAEIADGIRRQGDLSDPIVVDRDTGVVLDGHHRLAALERLDCDRVPVYLVEYDSDRIVVESWVDDRSPPSNAEVRDRAIAGDLFPPRTTKHLNVKDFEEVRVALSELR